MARHRDCKATNFFPPPGYTIAMTREVKALKVYLDLAVLLNFLVDFLLLMGANRLCGYPMAPGRAAAAAALGGIYAGVCLIPSFRFLGNLFWRLVSLAAMAAVAFGWNRSALRRGVLFVFLSMALGGIALGLGTGGFASLAAAAGGVCLLCVVGFRGKAGGRAYVTVKITSGGKTRVLTALRDTGNTLRDPMTGQAVLVAGADVAWDLFGLTREELKAPIETITAGRVPGLRLIPYRAVGQPGGMLLAVRVEGVVIDGQKAGDLVAFAPQILDGGKTYQALAGGVL